MSARHLVFVGLMGAGKTSVGRVCAERLGRPFVDTDELVESTTGMRVAEIFETQGEPAFRNLERVAVADACASPEPLVIACGGGAILDPDSRRSLREAGVVVWLRAAPEVLSRRVGTEPNTIRPLLAGAGSTPAAATLERLAVLRADAYAAAADLVVDTDGQSIDEVANVVVDEFERAST
ncbi:MAG: shikimate kinase [Acidimicrobiia bacterium]